MSIRVRISGSTQKITHLSMFNHLGAELPFEPVTATLSGLSDSSLRSVIGESNLEEGILPAVLEGSFGQREGREARRAF